MNRSAFLRPSRTLLTTAVLLHVAAAQAQQAGAGPVLEEVLVTAQKREQSLQDVPLSITAFTAATIDRAGIRDFSDYAVKTPNVGFQQRGSRADTRFGIRGITNVGGQASSVGVYVDEVNVVPNVITTGTSRTADISLLDVARIEVLRGPQGTFFGRNTMGGAINITTVKPDLESPDGKLTLEAADEVVLAALDGRVRRSLCPGRSSATPLVDLGRALLDRAVTVEEARRPCAHDSPPPLRISTRVSMPNCSRSSFVRVRSMLSARRSPIATPEPGPSQE